KYFPGTSWQRCQRHFLVNLMDKVPKRYRDRVHDELAWEQAKDRLEEMAESLYLVVWSNSQRVG
ncbi:MAG TPA: transposase, partial [Bacteroidales bacterium]|nr:transposase [Bacteroidales bacterium]HRT48764.1 transposase [Bacteroidales bacterium]